MKDDLYQADIVAWAKQCKDAPLTGQIDCRATVHNALCGDRISVALKLKNDVISDISCQVKGCMLSKASATHMISLLKDRPTSAVNELYQTFQAALKSGRDDPAAFPDAHRLFSPVSSRKSRHACVLLPYEAVLDALASQPGL